MVLEAKSDVRVIGLVELQGLVPLSRSQIWRLEKAGRFPRRMLIGQRRVAWRFSDIVAWLNARPSMDGEAH